jgi:hypothetical protein
MTELTSGSQRWVGRTSPIKAALAAGGVGLVLGMTPMILSQVPWMQSHVFTSDDRSLGLALHERPSAASPASDRHIAAEGRAATERCAAYALAIYDHPIPAASVEPFPGWATPAEKVFYRACIEGKNSSDPAD